MQLTRFQRLALSPRRRGRAAALLLAFAAAAPAHAQDVDTTVARPPPGWSVRRTMREFVNSSDPFRFFPTRGTWSWVVTTHYHAAPGRVGVWRFSAAQSFSALVDGPLCARFPFSSEAIPSTGWTPGIEERPWRRVGATRFVPPGRGARSPVFVEWRREDGRWVLAALGVEAEHRARVIGYGVDETIPAPWTPLRLPLPAWERVAAGAPWYENSEPITVGGQRLVKYGLPRQLREGDVVRWGTLRGVGVYAEPVPASRVPEVVYLPVDRAGTFQPYQNESDSFCAY
ncbi:MAG TPA: hypothetical protein VFJ82_14660 [Longimicrobium sp.]|nr:hypothetical protein [Longimicrobium sp.]